MTTALLIPAETYKPAQPLDLTPDVFGTFWNASTWRKRIQPVGAYWYAYLDEDAEATSQPANTRATSMMKRLGWHGGMLYGPVVFLADEPSDFAHPLMDKMFTVGAELPAEVLEAARQVGIDL
ncbi:hypothetical protein [Actinopolymorpha alba]|uniref:hypothetical protein n=1 Tax=Actinopolymorpha alba TaxID=533267 RepID=UPI0012F6F08E|nr:hypothetical protein [Actinopolymorpha alba]